MLVTILISVSAVLLYKKASKAHKYWKEKGIRYVRPWPFFGFMAKSILRLKAFPYVLQDLYNTFPEQRYFGCYQFLTPFLLVRDPELLKRIMVQELETFPEHRPMIDPDYDPLWAKNLFAMKGDEQWRDMRATISPAFTSSKMKNMFTLMKQCAQQFTDHFLKQGGIVSVELKDATTRFANDTIASTAFGVSCNSLENPNNEFYLMAKKTTDFNLSKMLKFFGYTISPGLMKFRFFGDNIINFYENLVKETIKVRKEKGINRPDVIHLLLEAQKGKLNNEEAVVSDSGYAAVQESEIGKNEKGKKTQITDEDIMAQATVFYFAGFETTSLGLSHLTYELALNADIQRRLMKEVDKVKEECNGEVTYEDLLRMKYLDMVVSETLRKWPPTLVTDRRCTQSFTIEPVRAWESTFELDVDTNCLIPIFSIHRDPKNYPEPNKFDPERFSDLNKHKIKPFTYLPFGSGPRSCIGSRFALLEMKTFIFHVLSEFEVIPVKKTQNPLVLSKKIFNAVSANGFWVGLKPRNKKTA